MKRRHLLASVSLVGATSVAGCSGASFTPQNGSETEQFDSGVWGDPEGVPGSRIFEDASTALERRIDSDAGDRFESFVRETDFSSDYLALVQQIGTGAAHTLTLRETKRTGNVLTLVIDEWPPTGDGPYTDDIVIHALATRIPRNGGGVPNDVEATVHRHDDRTLGDSVVDRTRYWI